MLKSIRAKILLAILTVTMFTACSLTVVFYFRAAGMIEENYSGILYGRMQQTIKDLDESLKEIYYVNTRTAWDTDIRNNAKEYSYTGNENSLENVYNRRGIKFISERDIGAAGFLSYDRFSPE